MNLACPHCGKVHDMHTEPLNPDEHHEPKDGDVSMCIACGEFAFFDGVALRLPTDDEAVMLSADMDIAHMRSAWRFVMEKHKR